MPSKRKFYRTKLVVEVLSDEPYTEDDLNYVNRDITDGDCSGEVTNLGSEEVDGPAMAKLLMSQASDPSFFNLTPEGEDTEDAIS